jgi:anti-sigma factor ChrR (cupin superfamily)
VPPHFHLGAGEFIVLSGELRYASGTAKPGDYGYEAIGAHHEKTHAVEETVIFYVGHGPLAMLDADGRICGATGSDGVNAFAMAHG